MLRSTSVPSKVLKVLQSGKKLTPKQITRRFGVKNPHDPAYVIEEEGYFVKRTYTRNKKGFDTVTYSM